MLQTVHNSNKFVIEDSKLEHKKPWIYGNNIAVFLGSEPPLIGYTVHVFLKK